MMQVTFREIANVLQTAGSQVVAAEGHGCLCGALCTTADYTLERWLDEGNFDAGGQQRTPLAVR